ncbi:MAG: hypothetical protein E7649_05680 [Ruminococcaceae bacterium]|nr:hypothetical protein [Oscillospiraceae bacterium]
MWEVIWHIFSHALVDSLWLLPFLFVTYICMELLEHKAGDKVKGAIVRTGRAGPIFGGLLGLIPQCGFSAASAGLFAGGVITPGTLLAVFLATSDEMLPIFLGASVSPLKIVTVLGIKLVIAVLVGFVADIILKSHRRTLEVEELCDEENCHCGERGIFLSSLIHTAQIFAFVFVINLALTAAFELIGEDKIAAVLGNIPVLDVIAASIVGLIPNCAASVLIATLWTKGMISGGAMIAGLLTGAGAGLLVLFRTNKRIKENLILTGILLASGIVLGCIFDLTGLAVILGL